MLHTSAIKKNKQDTAFEDPDENDFLKSFASCRQALRRWDTIDAAEILNAQVRQDGSTAAAFYLFASMRLLAGDLSQVKAFLLSSLEENPDSREALTVLTALEQRAGATASAERYGELLSGLIKGDVQEVEAERLFSHATELLSDPQQHSEATALFAKSLALAPWRAAAWLGLSLTSYGSNPLLCSVYASEALIRNPLLPDAWAMAIAGLAYSNDMAAAGRAVGRAISLFPDNEMVVGMIAALHETGGVYDPGISRAWYTLPAGRVPATLLKSLLNRRNDHAQKLRKNSVLKAYGSVDLHESSVTAYMRAITLNLIPANEAAHKEELTAVTEAVKAFSTMRPNIVTPAHIVGVSSQWGMNGENNREDRISLATSLRAGCPLLNYEAPAPKKGNGIRIAVVEISSGSTNAQGLRNLLGQFDPAQFSVCRFSPVFSRPPQPKEDEERRILPASLTGARAMIAEFDPHVVFFSSLDQHAWIYQLAFSRLAPVQIAIDRIANTSGIDTIDYVVSAEAFEPKDADGHYSEKLIRLPGIGADLVPSAEPKKLLSREDFLVPENCLLFFCPQPIYRIKPAFTQVLVEILKALPNAVIIIPDASGFPGAVMRGRLDGAAEGMSSRVKFWGRLNALEYRSILHRADIVLDGYPTSAGFALCDAFVEGTPIVTLRGNTSHTRIAAGMMDHVGLSELVAESPEAYAALSIKLGKNSAFRKETGEKIRSSASQLFQNKDGLEALQKFLLNAL